MYLVYIDESGTPGKKHKHYTILGLGIDIKHVRQSRQWAKELYDSLNSEYNYQYKNSELKGEAIYKLLKKSNRIDDYFDILESITKFLASIESFALAIVILKSQFRRKIVKGLFEYIDDKLSEPPTEYLNALRVRGVRQGIIQEIRETVTEKLTRAQGLNELLVRTDNKLREIGDEGILIIDAEAEALVQSTYALFASALLEEGVAVGGTLRTPTNIELLLLSKSNLDPILQLADVLVNSIHNCIHHGHTQIIDILHILTGEKGLVILPKGEEPCQT